MTLKKFALGAGVLAIPSAAMAAEGDYTVPTTITSGLTKLQSAGTAITDAVIPVLIAVGLAFLGCWLAVKIFRWFKTAAGR